ncbi:hypothetical protein AAMO2058_001253400 [Amorphochlora amoebiformis]|mmetsp:Transcript_32657/g.52581  ORF Transcript_32657/g.52581 Transcript_32657/m.52581 type:complete len:167 (-) Transcript_32657:123-623(-)
MRWRVGLAALCLAVTVITAHSDCLDDTTRLCSDGQSLCEKPSGQLVCVKCGNAYDVDCNECQCTVKTALVVGFVICVLFAILLIVVCTCYLCPCCPWYRNRRMAAFGRSRARATADTMLDQMTRRDARKRSSVFKSEEHLEEYDDNDGGDEQDEKYVGDRRRSNEM